MLNRELSFEEVVKMTQNLKCWKACGFDQIPNEVYEETIGTYVTLSSWIWVSRGKVATFV